jgi:hypothetical protein
MDDGRKLTFHPAQGEAQEIPVPEKELYLGEVEDMHAAVLDGQPNYLSLAETRNHVKTLLALYASAAEQRPISLYAAAAQIGCQYGQTGHLRARLSPTACLLTLIRKLC